MLRKPHFYLCFNFLSKKYETVNKYLSWIREWCHTKYICRIPMSLYLLCNSIAVSTWHLNRKIQLLIISYKIIYLQFLPSTIFDIINLSLVWYLQLTCICVATCKSLINCILYYLNFVTINFLLTRCFNFLYFDCKTIGVSFKTSDVWTSLGRITSLVRCHLSKVDIRTYNFTHEAVLFTRSCIFDTERDIKGRCSL